MESSVLLGIFSRSGIGVVCEYKFGRYSFTVQNQVMVVGF